MRLKLIIPQACLWFGEFFGIGFTVIILVVTLVCLFIQLRTAALRLIVQSWLDVPTFAIRRLHACHHARAPSSRRQNCKREMSGNFAEMTTSTPFRDLLHAIRLRHGTDGFTSPPKEGVLKIFSPYKSGSFGQVWTRELGYQRPAHYL